MGPQRWRAKLSISPSAQPSILINELEQQRQNYARIRHALILAGSWGWMQNHYTTNGDFRLLFHERPIAVALRMSALTVHHEKEGPEP